ncbi:MAG: SH3 domain-containing protein [Bacteroidaceae bacterium]|nr:SH3 domain-containing protein [Bacteroidaceae bacterium]
MKAICNLIVAMVLLFALPSNASADTQYRYKDVYATIQPGTDLNMRQGPGKNNPLVERVLGGSTVKIVNLDTYDLGWVCVESAAGNTGYVARRYLMGNYVEEFNSRELEPVIPEETYEEDTADIFIDQSSFWASFLNYLARVCNNLISLGWWAYLIVALALALVAGIVYYLRSYDPYFEEPWIHYVLYFLTILPTLGLCGVVLMYKYHPVFSDKILLFLFALVPAILSVHAGWGVRECGMYSGKYHKNANRDVGQLLQFPVWMMITLMFWYTFLLPLIELSEDEFCYNGGGFWRFVLGLIIVAVIISAVLLAWTLFFVRKFFKTAGNWPVRIMTIVLWWALTRIAFNWAYENFNGFGYLLMLFFGAMVLLGIIGGVLSELHSSRCPMCHNCDAEQTNLTDEGVSYSTSTGWESMGSGNIRPRHSGAEVSNAQRLVKTTVATHNWTTEHTCPACGCKWDISHSEEVGRDTQELKRSWTERY